MPYSQGSNLNAGFELVFSNFEAFSGVFYETLYQEVYWRKSIPGASIDTSINPGANFASYGVSDWRGIGGFISDFGNDAPTVHFSRDKVAVPIAYAGIKGVYTLNDMRGFQFAHNGQIDTELAEIMRKGSERHIEGVTMYGQPELGFAGYIDLPGVDIGNVPNGASTSPLWSLKTADEQIKDVQDGLRDVWTNSKYAHVPDTVELPPDQYSILNDTRVVGRDLSAMQWLKTNNLYTQLTGKELTVIPNPHLDGAGVAGVNRMILKENNPRNFMMPFPIPHNLLPPQVVNYSTNILAEYKFGGIHVRSPGCMAYRDGI